MADSFENLQSGVMEALRSGHFHGARTLLVTGAKPFALKSDYWRLRMQYAHATGDNAEFEAAVADMAKRGPHDAKLHLEVAMLCLQCGHLGAARNAALTGADCVRSRDGAIRDALGTVLARCGCEDRAVILFREASALLPDNPAILYNLATAERFVGRLDVADRILGKVLKLTPDHAEAHLLRSGLRIQTGSDNHIAALRSALASSSGRPAEQVPLLFALAKECEDIGDHAEAIKALKAGNGLRRSMMRYEVAGDVAAIRNIIEQFDATSVCPPCEFAPGSQAAIFIVGLPRSGTTLLETLLDRHSAITGAGELQVFPNASIEGVRHLSGGGVDKLQFAALSRRIDPTWLGARYMAEADPRATPHFIDKLPLNYLYLGLIRRSLPQARIILVERDPLDSCYAMYKTLFEDAYPFTYDLDDLAEYYIAYRQLVCHWQSVLGPALHVVHYEELVRQPESTLREVLSFLALPWEEGCLDPRRSNRAVSTASAVQVRQPVHDRSIGNWRPYADELSPLIAKLREVGIVG
jgi:tetratricopeptide (TPR) repeat protein